MPHPFFDTSLIASRRERNVKFIVMGICAKFDVEIAMDTDYNAVVAARLWAKTFDGNAYCYCVREGEIGVRPFASAYAGGGMVISGGAGSEVTYPIPSFSEVVAGLR